MEALVTVVGARRRSLSRSSSSASRDLPLIVFASRTGRPRGRHRVADRLREGRLRAGDVCVVASGSSRCSCDARARRARAGRCAIGKGVPIPRRRGRDRGERSGRSNALLITAPAGRRAAAGRSSESAVTLRSASAGRAGSRRSTARRGSSVALGVPALDEHSATSSRQRARRDGPAAVRRPSLRARRRVVPEPRRHARRARADAETWAARGASNGDRGDTTVFSIAWRTSSRTREPARRRPTRVADADRGLDEAHELRHRRRRPARVADGPSSAPLLLDPGCRPSARSGVLDACASSCRERSSTTYRRGAHSRHWPTPTRRRRGRRTSGTDRRAFAMPPRSAASGDLRPAVGVQRSPVLAPSADAPREPTGLRRRPRARRRRSGARCRRSPASGPRPCERGTSSSTDPAEARTTLRRPSSRAGDSSPRRDAAAIESGDRPARRTLAAMAKTLFDKVWDAHVVREEPGEPDAALRRPPPRPRGDVAAGLRGAPARRPTCPASRSDRRDDGPQRPDAAGADRRPDGEGAARRAPRELRGVRHPRSTRPARAARASST